MTAPAATPSVLTADDQPIHTHPDYDRLLPEWTKVRDLLGGTTAVKARRTLYLPKHEAELDKDYEVRLKLGVLYNGFKRTLGAMTGLVTQRDVELGEEASEVMRQHWETIDGRGLHGAVFARRLLHEGLATNHAGVLVDVPALAPATTPRSKAEERQLGVRPFWRLYRAEDIRDWDYTTDAGETVLRLLLLREAFYDRAARFRVQEVTQYRVFEWHGPSQITWELWREVATGGVRRAERLKSGVVVGPRRIPFAFFHPAEFAGLPPLIDLADLNLAHYRTDTDRRHLMRIGCLPVPVRIGYQKRDKEPEKPWGTNTLQDVPTGGDVKWAEITGAAFEVTGKDLQMIEARMGAMGLAFLQPETRGTETAEAKRIDATAQNATLASSARALQDTLEMAAGFHAEYLKADPVSISVPTDFERTVMSPEMIGALSRLEVAGQLSLETLLRAFKTGHVLGDDVDLDHEIARILADRATRTTAGDGGANGDGDPGGEVV